VNVRAVVEDRCEDFAGEGFDGGKLAAFGRWWW
jgi:hypothetical protein